MSQKIVKIYEKVNGNYSLVNGKIVMPFNFGMLLDERLDEGYINLVGCSKDKFRPYTPFKVELYEDESLEKSIYFVLANDNGYEYPRGTNKYSHELYLIERTKWLEAFYCQSLVFTNTKGNVYTDNPAPALFSFTTNLEEERQEVVLNAISNIYKTPIKKGETVSPLSIANLGNIIISALDTDYGLQAYRDSDDYTYLRVKNGNTTTTYSYNQIETIPSSVVVDSDLQLTYNILFARFVNGQATGKLYTFTVTYTIVAVQNRYPLKPYTIADVIDRVLDLAEPHFVGEAPRFRLSPIQAEEFAKIKSPQFSMTQCTLREQLKVVGGHIHKEPRLGWLNPDTNEYEENTIYFDDIGVTKPEIKLRGKQNFYKGIKWDGNDYCTSVETSAANLVNSLKYAQGVVIEPNANNYKTVRTDSINVLLSEPNAFAQTSLPIYDAMSIECGLYDGSTGAWILEPIDIIAYLFEKHEYDSVLSSFGGVYPYSKSYGIYYSQGSKNIGGLFYKPDEEEASILSPYLSKYAIVNILEAVSGESLKDAVTNNFCTLAFRIKYIPIYSARFSHGKSTYNANEFPVSKVYSQSENQIETTYFGQHIKGVAQRLGNVEQTRTYIFGHFREIPRLAYQVDGYSISAINCSVMPNYIKCTVGLSKNYNRINEFIGIDSHKRISEVSERQAQLREILLKNYIVVSENPLTYPNISNRIFGDYTAIRQIFDPSYNNNGVINTLNAVRVQSYAKNDEYDNKPFGKAILPVISSAFGNAITFSWSFKDNYSAGEDVTRENIKREDADDLIRYWQTDKPYGDYYGRAYLHDFWLYQNYPYGAMAQALTVEPISTNPPDPPPDPPTTTFYTQQPLVLRKDSREIISFNFEIEFKANTENLIVGSALASACPLVTGKTYTTAPKVYFFDKPINNLATEIDVSSAISSANLSVDIIGENLILTFDMPTEFTSWAIVTPTTTGESITYEDEDGNVEDVQETYGGEILIASNNSEYTPTKNIYLTIVRDIYKN